MDDTTLVLVVDEEEEDCVFTILVPVVDEEDATVLKMRCVVFHSWYLFWERINWNSID